MVATYPVAGERWKNYVRRASKPFETAVVQVLDPDTTAETPYNPVDNTGGDSAPIVVWPILDTEEYGEQPYGEGPYGGAYAQEANAWVEIINSAGANNNPPQATDVARVHVHLDLERTEVIKPGMILNVIDGGRDSVLEHRLIVIRKVTTGNLAVQRTLECTIDEKAYI